jgi:hypothetical protein
MGPSSEAEEARGFIGYSSMYRLQILSFEKQNP